MAQGIENIKKDIKLISDAVKQGEASFKDGFQFTDIFSFAGFLTQIPDVINTFKSNVLPEVGDLTQQESEELLVYISTEFVLKNKKLEENVKNAIAVVFATIKFVKGLKPTPVVVAEPLKVANNPLYEK